MYSYSTSSQQFLLISSHSILLPSTFTVAYALLQEGSCLLSSFLNKQNKKQTQNSLVQDLKDTFLAEELHSASSFSEQALPTILTS